MRWVVFLRERVENESTLRAYLKFFEAVGHDVNTLILYLGDHHCDTASSLYEIRNRRYVLQKRFFGPVDLTNNKEEDYL